MNNESVKCSVINIKKEGFFSCPGHNLELSGEGMPHYHDELEFLSVYDGVFLCVVYGKEYIVKSGEVLFVSSRIPHIVRCVEPGRAGFVHFKESGFIDTEKIKAIKYAVRFHSRVFSPVKVFSSPQLFAALDLVQREEEEKKRSYETFVRSGVYGILGYLYREGVLPDAERIYSLRQTQKVLLALNYINNNYKENLTLDSLSARLGFDESYFCRMFKTAIGITFTEYLNFVRICKAEKMLLKSQDGILKISESVGFSSVSYFNRIFKKYHNCSPRIYRTVKFCKM